MKLTDIHRWIDGSEYKTWQVYLLLISIVVTLGIYFDVEGVSSVLHLAERSLSEWDWLALLGIQGVLIGFVAEFLYEQGDSYAKSASHLFGSKDRTLFFRIGVMTAVSGIITQVVPPVLESSTEYITIQSFGAIIVLGILLIHIESSNWNPETEWPAIVAGILLATSPSLL